MDPKPVVFDISSDEECWGETREDGGGGGGDDVDWLSELLEKVDGEADDDSDDVVLVGEVVSNPNKRRSKSTNSVVKSSSIELDDDDDDDCVVLDGDPDKPVAIENDTAGESDELLIVGEKGQIACRDYPHPRHHCAAFPFNSTPHERHCSLCHCYVCDSHAPCVHWGTGTSRIDHCHATDKEEFWKLQRKNVKQVDKSPLQVPKLPEISLVSQNQISRPPTIRACSTSTNPVTPNFANPDRTQRGGYVLPRNKFQPHLASSHLLNSRSNIIRKDRRHIVCNLGSQFLSPDTISKRTGPLSVSLAANQSGYYGSQYSRNVPSVPTANDRNPIGQQVLYTGMTTDSPTYHSYSQQNTSSIFENSVAVQLPVHSQQNTGSIFVNTLPPQPQVPSQPNMGPVFVSTVPPQPQVPSQPNMGPMFVNPVPPQPNTSESNMRIIFPNPVLPQPCETFQPNASQVYSPTIPGANDVQDGFQQGNQTQLNQSFSDYDSSWIDLPSRNNQVIAENSQLQCGDPTFSPPLVTEFDPQFSGDPNTASLDFQFDNWFLDHQSVSEALEVSVPPGFNVLSPEPAHINSGMFFDF